MGIWVWNKVLHTRAYLPHPIRHSGFAPTGWPRSASPLNPPPIPPTPTTTRTTAAEPSTRYDFPIPVPGRRLTAPSPRRVLNPSVPPSLSRRVLASRRRPSGHPGVALRGRLPSRPSDSFRSPCHRPFRVPPPPPVASSSAVVAVNRRLESYDLIHLTRENSYISSPSFVTPFQAPRGRSAPVAVAPRSEPAPPLPWTHDLFVFPLKSSDKLGASRTAGQHRWLKRFSN